MPEPTLVVKNPIPVMSLQWDGENFEQVQAFTEEQAFINDHGELIIPTLEGNHRANIGDYIICGVKGEFYPCAKDVFDSTYTPAKDALPDVQKWTTGGFAQLMMSNGVDTSKAAEAVQVVRDITQVTDGKKPIYVIAFDPLADNDSLSFLAEQCIAANLAALFIPQSWKGVVGLVEDEDYEARQMREFFSQPED